MGLAIGNNGSGDFVYATNFRNGVVEIYDATFQFVKAFTDATIPSGFAPFGIRNINKQTLRHLCQAGCQKTMMM